MKQLFNKSMARQMSLVEEINQSEESSVIELANQFGADVKTIMKDIKEINKTIYPLEVVPSVSLTYYVEVPPGYSFDFVYISFLAKSPEFQLLELIFKNETYSGQELSKKLFLSLSSLRRRVIRLNTILQSEGIRIESNPYRIRGDEKRIVNFFVHYLVGKYTISQNYLSEFEQKNITHLVNKILTVSKIKENFHYRELTTWLIVVSLVREKHGVSIEGLDIGVFEAVRQYYAEEVILHKKFKSVFKVGVTTSLLCRSTYLVIQPGYAYTTDQWQGESLIGTKSYERGRRIEALLAKIVSDFKLTSPPPEVALKLYNISITHLGKVRLLNNLDDVFLKEAQKKWPEFIQMLTKEYEASSQYLATEQFSVFVFQLVSEWTELAHYLSRNQKKLTIGLFYTTTQAHMEYVARELQRFLPDILTITFLDDGGKEELLTKEIDVIVTNINDFSNTKKVICLSRDIDSKDVAKVSKFYEQWLLK